MRGGCRKRYSEVEKVNIILNCVFAHGPPYNTLKKDLYHSALEFIPHQGIPATHSMATIYDFWIRAWGVISNSHLPLKMGGKDQG